jgi:hypothetical protein
MPVVTATGTNTDLPKQLSDQNSLGTVLGASPTDKIGFFGNLATTAITQPATQGSLKGGVGIVTEYASTITPLSVANATSAEQTFTVTGLATGQVVAVNKPTSQAGLIVGQARVSALNTVGITFGNDTAASITPTAGETYFITAFPANMVISATLTPLSVAPNTTAEQTFTVTGLPPGVPVVVNKPTAQAGLVVLQARASAASTLAITYANVTAATITPTAGESYLIFAAGEVQIAPIMKGTTAALVPASVANGTTAEQTFTVSGLIAGTPVIVNKPTLQAGLGIAGARVSAANTLAINFVNTTTATITPAAETYYIGQFPTAAPAAGSSTAFNGQFGGPTVDHAALVALGLVAGP